MRSNLLHVITPSFNIRRWQSHGVNMRRFVAHMRETGVHLTIAELAYGDIDFEFAGIDGVTHVGLYGKTPVWQKERLINAAIARLPRDWKYVAWVDGDITFENPGWAAETVYALQHYDFVQPWEHCYDLGPHGEHLELHHSFGRQWIKDSQSCERMGASGYTFAHPGYAWAATRSALEKVGGLIDTAALGAADHHMALALIGKAHLSVPANVSPAYRRHVMRWQDRANHHIAGNLGFVPGTIRHSYHGDKEGRRYVSRWSILEEFGFDPDTDLKVNTSGAWELAGHKPELRRTMMAYFAGRGEDKTTISAASRLESAE